MHFTIGWEKLMVDLYIFENKKLRILIVIALGSYKSVSFTGRIQALKRQISVGKKNAGHMQAIDYARETR
jgi:hypothetical protein